MKRKKLKLREILPDASIEPISELDIRGIIGGQDGSGPSYDCVLNVFDYLDEGYFSASYYDMMTYAHFYYHASEQGGVRTEDIPAIGGFGRMAVTQTDGINDFDNATGKTGSGNSVAITIPGASNMTHMVVLERVELEDGVWQAYYYDPTFDKHSHTEFNNVQGFYEVGPVGSYDPILGSIFGNGS